MLKYVLISVKCNMFLLRFNSHSARLLGCKVTLKGAL